ncbi:MAG: acyl carrier protein [Actinobacteria bacterium]|nr:acyl carrier protein [Actinomycetota bacterium]
MTTQDRVREFISDELNLRVSAGDLVDDYPLLETDVLDSMGIFQVVAFLEDEFGIEVDDAELVPENFETIGSIAKLIDSKREA